MSHFNLNITEIPVYNDGSFLLYKLKQADEVFPYEQIEKLYDVETDEEINEVSPGVKGQKVKMKLPIECKKDWIIRRKK